ncbi:MAG: hypothetical protein CL949_21445 [Erythrobacter sp.]|nr:hypothetical protein [Erythrobacter sp.]
MKKLGENFWMIRGDLRIAGMLNVGTQCSLVRLEDGNFVFLDSYTLDNQTLAEVNRLTNGGRDVSAIINLHPYHTLHCEWMHGAFPQAKLYGTRRHETELPDLPWESTYCETAGFGNIIGPQLQFSTPDGTRLVCEDDTVHFASVLAYHPESGTIHVDDTLSRLTLPFPLSALPISGRIGFHPSLEKALEPEAGAADRFREWAIGLGVEWADARHLTMAHNSMVDLGPDGFADVIGKALGRVKPVLDKHRETYG